MASEGSKSAVSGDDLEDASDDGGREDEAKSIAEMAGETIREGGLLLLVFAYLDVSLAKDLDPKVASNFLAGAIFYGLLAIYVGMTIERVRKS